MNSFEKANPFARRRSDRDLQNEPVPVGCGLASMPGRQRDHGRPFQRLSERAPPSRAKKWIADKTTSRKVPAARVALSTAPSLRARHISVSDSPSLDQNRFPVVEGGAAAEHDLESTEETSARIDGLVRELAIYRVHNGLKSLLGSSTFERNGRSLAQSLLRYREVRLSPLTAGRTSHGLPTTCPSAQSHRQPSHQFQMPRRAL